VLCIFSHFAFGGYMKKLVFVALLTLSSHSFASFSVSNSIAYTIAEVIYTVAIPVVSTGATTAATDNRQKVAVKIRNDIQAYYQSGELSLELSNQVETAQKIDTTLSLDETLDVLTDAANIIINQ
jgi:hypothetical protein